MNDMNVITKDLTPIVVNRVSSVGCQTVPPDQWDEFLDLATTLAKSIHGASNWKKAVYPYVLIEE